MFIRQFNTYSVCNIQSCVLNGVSIKTCYVTLAQLHGKEMQPLQELITHYTAQSNIGSAVAETVTSSRKKKKASTTPGFMKHSVDI